MINTLYDKYFQKSRSFLYPLLGISRQSYAPIQTYLALDDVISPEDKKLVCMFQNENSRRFRDFEEKMLVNNPLYMSSETYIVEPSIYIFDFSNYSEDWNNFLNGKYSKLSKPFKDAIKNYYGEKTAEYKYIDTYLYPEKYFELYSNLLDLPVNTLSNIGELCNKYDPEKEKLTFSPKSLENNSI